LADANHALGAMRSVIVCHYEYFAHSSRFFLGGDSRENHDGARQNDSATSNSNLKTQNFSGWEEPQAGVDVDWWFLPLFNYLLSSYILQQFVAVTLDIGPSIREVSVDKPPRQGRLDRGRGMVDTKENHSASQTRTLTQLDSLPSMLFPLLLCSFPDIQLQ
jgi:hypothetical protein